MTNTAPAQWRQASIPRDHMSELSVLTATITTMTTTGVPVGTYTPGTELWHQLRRDKLGGSEIAAVLGLSPYESKFSLWHRKTGTVPPKEGSTLTEWGNRLEPAIYAKFCENHPDYGWTYQPGTYVHPDRAWQLASPDGISQSGSYLIEIKTVQYDDEWGDEGTSEIPVHYRAQVLWNMDAVGAELCWVPVLIRGSIYREYLITWDEEAEHDIDTLTAAGQQFIADLEAGIPPDIDGSNATREILRAMSPDINYDESVELPQEVEHDYLMAELIYKQAKTERDTHVNHILAALGNARYATSSGRRFALRAAKLNKETGEYGTPYLMTDRKRLTNFKGRPTLKETA